MQVQSSQRSGIRGSSYINAYNTGSITIGSYHSTSRTCSGGSISTGISGSSYINAYSSIITIGSYPLLWLLKPPHPACPVVGSLCPRTWRCPEYVEYPRVWFCCKSRHERTHTINKNINNYNTQLLAKPKSALNSYKRS